MILTRGSGKGLLSLVGLERRMRVGTVEVKGLQGKITDENV